MKHFLKESQVQLCAAGGVFWLLSDQLVFSWFKQQNNKEEKPLTWLSSHNMFDTKNQLQVVLF